MKSLFTILTLLLSLFSCSIDNESNNLDQFSDVQYVNVLDYGALGNGVTDDTQVIQDLLNDPSVNSVLLKEDRVFICTSLIVPSNKTIIIDGILRVNDSINYANEIQTFISGSGVSNIKITGNGTIDGNKSNLNGGYFSLINFVNGNDIEVSNLKIKDSRFPNAIGNHVSDAIIHFKSSKAIKIDGLRISDWGREGIFLNDCDNSSVTDVNMDGDIDSWSGIQVQGYNNIVNSCIVKNAGASSFGFDSKYSSISNCISEGNRYSHGFNFGHLNTPPDPTQNCLISNCISRGSAENGFNFNRLSTGNQIINCISEAASNAGFYISDGENSFQNISAKNGTIGLKLNADASIYIVNGDFSGNSNSAFFEIINSEKKAKYNFTNVRLSNDPFSGGIDLVNVMSVNSYPGVTRSIENGIYYYIIPNENIRKQSKVKVEAVHVNSASAQPFIREINTNFIKVGLVNGPVNPAWIRFYVE